RQRSLFAVSAAGGTPQQLMENVLDATISPDGKTMVFLRETAGSSSTLWISSPPGNPPTRYPPDLFDSKDYHTGLAKFSPDGSKIAFVLLPTRPTGTFTELWIVPFLKGKPRKLLQKMHGLLAEDKVSWMPDSRYLVTGAKFSNAT